MRTIGKGVINKIIINDPIGGSEMAFFYRIPTTEERQQYSSSLFQTKGRKVKTMVSEARQRFGGKILVGIREGDFIEEEDGRKVFISSDPESPLYRGNWKQLVMAFASDLIETLAFHVFEGAKVVPEEDEDSEDEKFSDDGDEIPN